MPKINPNDGLKQAPSSTTESGKVQDVSRTSTPLVGAGIYDLDYFSGSQCALYIGDVYVDEVVNIQYSVQQSKMPIYGYASQLFDAVAHGQVLVQGSFTINFKEAGYLWLVLQRYKFFDDNTREIINKYLPNRNDINFASADHTPAALATKKNPKSKLVLGGANVPFARLRNGNRELDFISRAGVERLISGEATKDERFQFYQDLAGYATVAQGRNARDKAFEDIVEVFEDQVWQEDVSSIDDLTRRIDDNQFDDFDMFVVYGDYTKPGANHTVRRIRNVHLLSTGQQIQMSGENILEEYQFIARQII